MKMAIVVYSNDAETVWNAFRFANTCLIYGDQTSVFLLGKGVEAVAASTLQFDVDEQVALFREQGGAMIGCGVCCENRKDEMPSLAAQLKCDMGSMQDLHALIAEADKVLTF